MYRYVIAGVLALIGAWVALVPREISIENLPPEPVKAVTGALRESLKKDYVETAPHLPTPDAVRAIYMTSCAASTQSFREHITKLLDETELNSLVLDIKDYSGTISFKPESEALLPLYEASTCPVSDMREFIADLHERGVYVIGRITVFQDPYLTKVRPNLAVKRESDGKTWTDHKGLSFTDPGSKEVWDHVLSIADESYRIGFDELNFDYIRFPSDGNMRDILFSHSGKREKEEVIEEFFSYLNEELKDEEKWGKNNLPVTSADLFGMTTTASDDMNIGQILERALPYFDYIAPMVYPSHYPSHFNGWGNPNEYPYELIYYALESAVERTLATSTPHAVKGARKVSVSTSTPTLYEKESFDRDKIRPWLQDFDYGGEYDARAVRAQIQATYDVGLDSWMLWDPSNRYTREALEEEERE